MGGEEQAGQHEVSIERAQYLILGLLLAPTSPLSDVERHLILPRSTGAWMERLRQLIHEIHRRSLWQVLTAYVVASVVVLGGLGTLSDVLRLPEWFSPLAFALLIVGLPVVLATAFVQEGGPRREARDVQVAAPPGGAAGLFNWRNAFGGGVLAFALLGFVGTGWILFGGGLGGGSDTGDVPQQATIAVLPFQNNSPDAENAYFADGIHEDILTQLSKIGALTVISRTSVMRYRDAQESNLRQIGEELGATVILEGSFRRVGNQIRVTVQLIDTETDAHLWAETYDRELEDVFAVQSEIAEQVAAALQATLTPQEATRIARAPTGNLDAYDFVLRAQEAANRFTEEGNEESIRLLNLALELDPEYALAWARLATSYALRPYAYGGDPAWGDSALVLAERALELDPEEPGVHWALAFVYGNNGWHQQAREESLRTLELNPNHAYATNSIGVFHMFAGRLDEAIPWYERAVRLDPTGFLFRSNLSHLYLSIGDTTRAVILRRENLALQEPGGVMALRMQAELAVIEDGDYDRALELEEQRIEREPASADLRFDAAQAAFGAGDYERVIEHMTEGLRLSPNARTGALIRGLALIQTGQGEEGREALAEVIEWRREQIAGGNEESDPWLDLVVAYGALGETAEALDAFDQVSEIGDIGRVFRESHRQALALSSLRSEPRFQEVWRKMEEDLAEMRRRIEAR